MRVSLQFAGTSKGAGLFSALVASGLMAADVTQSDGSEIQVGAVAIGGLISGASSGALLYSHNGLLANSSFLKWDSGNFRLGVSQDTPLDALHVGGTIRFDSDGNFPVINLKFGNTPNSAEAALIQFRDQESYSFGSGAVVCGLGYTNASWGWTENGIILNTGCALTFGTGNVQAGLDGGQVFGGDGIPDNALGNDGDFYFRKGNPGVALQRIYAKAAGVWTGVV